VASPSAKTALAAQPAAKAVAEEESAAPNSLNNQGIKVHGHWVLQVKNADGTLGERREFDNSLVPGGTNTGGDQMLAALLTGNITAGDPAVAFVESVPTGTTDVSGICFNGTTGSIASYCYLLTTAQNYAVTMGGSSNYQTGLITTLNSGPTVNWVLSGNLTVPSGMSSITLVQTTLTFCFSGSSPFSPTGRNPLAGGSSTKRTADLAANACVGIRGGEAAETPSGLDGISMGTLTSTAVSPGPLTVVPGQIVQVTVTITFS
jgi:hypothetical protein